MEANAKKTLLLLTLTVAAITGTAFLLPSVNGMGGGLLKEVS